MRRVARIVRLSFLQDGTQAWIFIPIKKADEGARKERSSVSRAFFVLRIDILCSVS
jgi:hypothetical protein